MRACPGEAHSFGLTAGSLWAAHTSGLSEAKEVQPLLGLFNNGLNVIVPLQVLRDGAAQESEWLHCSHSAVHDGEWGESRGVSPEVHDPLHCFERVELQVVKPVQWAAEQHTRTRACVCVCVCVCLCEGNKWVSCKFRKGNSLSFIITYYLIHTPEQMGVVMHQKVGCQPL